MSDRDAHSLTDVERGAVRAALRRYKAEALAALKLLPADTAEYRSMATLLDGVDKAEEQLLRGSRPRRIRKW
jgi:hypothetical protein